MRFIIIRRHDPFEDRMDQYNRHTDGYEILYEIKGPSNDLPVPIDRRCIPKELHGEPFF